MFFKKINGFKVALGSLAIIWCLLFVGSISSLLFAEGKGAAGSGGGSAAVYDEDAGAPTKIAGHIIDAVDEAGGSWISKAFAVFIVGLPILALYRFLQWMGNRTKVPVGTAGCKIVAGLMGLVLGSESAWQNRVMSPRAPPDAVKREKQKVLNKLGKEHPLVNAEIKKIINELYQK